MVPHPEQDFSSRGLTGGPVMVGGADCLARTAAAAPMKPQVKMEMSMKTPKLERRENETVPLVGIALIKAKRTLTTPEKTPIKKPFSSAFRLSRAPVTNPAKLGTVRNTTKLLRSNSNIGRKSS